MSSFDKRKDSFEGKFAHDETLDFAIEARACKIFGLWVAAQLGLDDADAQTYASSVVEANLEEAGFEDVFRKVRPDLAGKNLDISDHILNVEMGKAVAEAKEQMASE